MTDAESPLRILVSAGSSDLVGIANEAATRRQQSPEWDPRGINSDGLVGVVFAALSVEAFLNELPELEWTRLDESSSEDVRLSGGDPRITSVRRLLRLAKDAKMQSPAKLQLAHETLGHPLERGTQLLQDYDLLKKLRDALAHPKTSMITLSTDPPRLSMTPGAGLLRTLHNRGLLSDDPANRGVSMLHWLSGPLVAAWAVKVAANTVMATVEAFPATEFRWALALYFARFWQIAGRKLPDHPEAR